MHACLYFQVPPLMRSMPLLGVLTVLPDQLLMREALLCPEPLVMFVLLDCVSHDASAPALQGITRTESDELWQQHAGPVLASLDSAGLEAVLAVLFLLMELRRCRRTIEGKGWWGVTAKLVAWIYCSRVRGMGASDCLKKKREATGAEVRVAAAAGGGCDGLRCSQPWSARLLCNAKSAPAAASAVVKHATCFSSGAAGAVVTG